MGFYRHDQWGLLALLTIHGFNSLLLLWGWSPSRKSVIGGNHQQEGATLNVNAQAHDMLSHDVKGTDLWQIHLNWSVLQFNCKFKLQTQFQIKPYACLLLFTHFKMVKHVNKLHILNPCIFLIIFHILHVKFGVKMNLLWIIEV